jgi:hypothetical protein
MISRIRVITEFAIFCILIGMLLSGSNLVLNSQIDRVRLFTRSVEFDFLDWTVNAIGVKLAQGSLNTPFYFDLSNRHQIVVDYLKFTDDILNKEYQLNLIYVDPSTKDPASASKALRSQIAWLYSFQRPLAPIAEAVLEEQVSEVLLESGLTFAGQPVPSVLFHITPLPYNIIISPRNKIQQDFSISLVPDLGLDAQVNLENAIDSSLGVSTLVVPVGGIGTYPTMVERSTALNWLSSTIAHEWIHNWLTLRPLGSRYEKNGELRTMNETTASIAGDEIGKLVIQGFYPELALNTSYDQSISFASSRPDPNDLPPVPFDYRVEMHKTRVMADDLLGQGKITEAENYMESRRQVFWDNGYAIRKLNQAYFAFYGAYADVPGGAAGEDPVGPAVRALRAKSPSLAAFLIKISKMESFNELKAAVSP